MNRKQHRALGRWLLAVAPELLRLILHAAGRRTREVCRHFRHVYGPPPGALFIPEGTSPEDVLALCPDPARSPHIHTLYFPMSSLSSHALLSTLARAFPNLRSLPFSMRDAAPADAMSALAPLGPTLTHLTILHMEPPAAIALAAAALPRLRALEFTMSAVSAHCLNAVLDALAGGLPHLRDLAVYRTGVLYSAALLGKLAGGLPHLTRLHLAVDLGDWDSEAAATLASAWPQLADLKLYISTTAPPVGLAGALAQHTDLTRLVCRAPDMPDWHLLRPLPIRELEMLTNDGAWPARVASFSAITKLTLGTDNLHLDDTMAGPLMQLGDSLLSLHVKGFWFEWGDLLHLTRFSKLQDLTLVQRAPWPWDQGVTAEQAAAGLAAGLSSLRYLDVSGLRQYLLSRSLVAGLGVHGRLRELHVGEWDPRWPVRLHAVAGTLARLTMSYRERRDVPLLISSLKGLTRLHYLHVCGWEESSKDPHGQYGAKGQRWVEGRGPPGRKPAPPEPEAIEWREWRQLKVGAWAAAGRRAGEAQVWLPPRLRVLHMPTLASFELKLQGVLRDVARQQGCALWYDAPYPYPADRDDCGGYEEGATVEWLRKHGRL